MRITMGRPKLLEPKIHVGGRVSAAIKRAMDKVGEAHKWTPSQVLAIALEESPRIKDAKDALRIKGALRNGCKPKSRR